MIARVVPSAPLAALASPVAPRVALLRIGRVLLTAEAPRAAGLLRTAEAHRIEAVLRVVEVHRVGAALRIVAVHRVSETLRVVAVLRIRVRACGPGDQDLPVELVAMMVVEAKSPHAEVGRPGIHRRHAEVGAGRRRLNRAVMLSARILMSRRMATRSRRHVMVTDAASAAKKGSGFRRRFREPVLRLVVRLRIGFEPGVSLSMAN